MSAKLGFFVAFVATVFGANWVLNRYGVVGIGFGLMAPAGVYSAGLAFGLRDLLREAADRTWRRWVLSAIAVGAILSYVLGDAVTLSGGRVPVALASAIAFGLSELADAAVYEPLRERGRGQAAFASNLVGAVIDSALFLWLAFGSLDYLFEQVVGKMYMVAPVVAVLWLMRSRRQVVAA